MRKGYIVGVFIGLFWMSNPPIASAQDDPKADRLEMPGPAFEIAPEIDIPVIALGATVASAWLLNPELSPAHCAPLCDKQDVFAGDRSVAGRWDPNWSLAGDIGAAAILLGSVGTLVVDEGIKNGLNDTVIVAESVLVTNMLSTLTNLAVRRPRPYLYGTEASESRRSEGEATLSFFSGHTANAFAAVWTTFQALRRLHSRSVLPWMFLGVGIAGASFVGASRVLAGQHFLTDVLAGAIVGSSIGILVPELHTPSSSIQAQLTSDRVVLFYTAH